MYKFINFLYNSIKGDRNMNKTYTIVVHEEDNFLWAECLEIEGCFAQAKTIDEIKEFMKEAIQLYLENNINEYEKNKEINLELSYA